MNEEIETVEANLCIQVNVYCPSCGDTLNLLEPDDTSNEYHNEEGYVISQAVPDGQWTDEHENFSVDDVTCTYCDTTFNVKRLNW